MAKNIRKAMGLVRHRPKKLAKSGEMGQHICCYCWEEFKGDTISNQTHEFIFTTWQGVGKLMVHKGDSICPNCLKTVPELQ